MRFFRLKSALTLLILTAIVVAAGCSNNTAAEKPGNGSDAGAAAGSPVKLTWWHSMSGNGEKAIKQIAADFNASHKDIQVEPVYQGKYDDSLNKLKASLGSDSGPDIIQVYEIGSKFMIDSKMITPVQQFIDAEK
ncbi:extracellular solute-binding protein, partial [Paenibacillus sp. 28ISP30-2]|nr:extracellular solute-binding protein [Paenibacillus sp. 28ISP30-2]